MSDFWRMGMQSSSAREAQMRARVAETSIDAARVVDAFVNPEVTLSQKFIERRIATGPMRGMASADLKHCSGGSRGTFAAADFYLQAARQRRDEVFAKVAAAESAAADEA